jgi:adenosylhomocysteine nucleosidase
MTLALIAALPAEIKPLVRGWRKRGPLFLGRIGSTEAVAIAAGMGAAAATRACAAVLAAGQSQTPVDTFVSLGYAGSASCGLTPPQACLVREVIDAATGERFATDLPADSISGQPRPQRLITLDRVADPAEKRRLAAQYQAVLVDMEAAAVARFAREHNLGFLCFKAVTDGANDKLPDFNRFTTAEGEWCMTPFLAYLAIHPQYWGAVRSLARNSRAASLELANLVHRFVAGTQ